MLLLGQAPRIPGETGTRMTRLPLGRIVATVLVLAAVACTRPAAGQTPRLPPQVGYQFHDERAQGPFVVQRWVASDAPDVSPAGTCDCLTLVYEGTRRLLTLGKAGDVEAIAVDPLTGRDINGDGFPDIVVTRWSGGAHCCYGTTVYSAGSDVRTVLSLETGNCGSGTFADLDGDGVLEFSTCDDRWSDAYCVFALAPFPTVVFAYNTGQREYQLATPRFAGALQRLIDGELDEARKLLAEDGGKDAGADKCRVLQPALDLMYSGRLDEGVELIRRLYPGGDLDTFVQDVTRQTRASPLWKPAP